MNPVCEDMKDILEGAGEGTLGAQTGWGIFIGDEPDEPKTAITLYDTGGRVPGYTFNNEIKPLRHESFQVRVRGSSYLSSHQKAEDIMLVLAQIGIFDVTPPGESRVNYKNIFQAGDLIYLGKNSTDGFIWVGNYTVVREEK